MKKISNIILSVCIVLALYIGTSMPVKAASHHDSWSAITMGNSYIKIDGVEQTSNTIPSGNYYLDESFTVNSILSIEQDAVVNLCLNNQTLSFTSYYYIKVDEGATLSVSDCGSRGTISAGISGNAPTVEVYHGTFNLSSGTLVNTGPSSPGRGAVYNYGGTFNMTGGSIIGRHCGIYLESLGTTNISGGLIEASNAIYIDHGSTLYLIGCPAINGTSSDIYSKRLIASKIYANDRASNPTYYSGNALTIYAGSADLTSSNLGKSAVNGVNSSNQTLFSLLNKNYHFEIDETNQSLTLHGDNVSLSWMDGETNLTDTTSDYPSTAEYSQTITLPCPEKDGFIFMGWSDGSKTYSLGSKPSVKADMVLTAQWVEMFSGNGTKEEPYEISSVEDLQKLGLLINKGYEYLNNSGVYYVLTNDLDLGAVCGSNINGADVSWAPIGTFCANFDGNKKTIANLYINNGDDTDTDSGCCGLFSHISNSTIKDLTLENVNITAGYASGTLAGVAENSTISNITVTGAVSGLFDIGALAGLKSSNNLSNINTSGVSVLMDGVSVSHSYNLTVTEPTCTNNGYTTHACTICGESYIDTFVNATGHSYTAYTLNDDATCEVNGTETATCDNGCGTTDTRTIEGSKKECDWQFTEDPTIQKCSYCGNTRSIGYSGMCGINGNNLTWTLDSEGTLTISGSGKMRDFYFDDYAPWYEYRNDITNIVIEQNVATIGEFAFYRCTKIETCSLPDTISQIGDYAFNSCNNLNKIVLPLGLTTIGNNAFHGCDTLEAVYIPETVTSLDSTSFSRCSFLTKIVVSTNNPKYSDVDGVLFSKDQTILLQYPSGKTTEDYCIPEGTVSAEADAFWHSSIKTITIPASMEKINSLQFNFCESLESIYVDGSNKYYCEQDGILFNKDMSAIIRYPSGKTALTYEIPVNVDAIGDDAFEDCANLTTIVIPNTVSSIGRDAFYGCSSLTELSLPETLTTINSGAFRNCSSLTQVVWPASLQIIDNFMFSNCLALEDVVIPAGVESIGHYAFFGCKKLTTVHLYTDADFTVDADGNDYFSNAAKHYLEQTATEITPTCSESGHTAEYCCNNCCMVIIEKETISALGHDLTYHEARAATCTEIGWAAYMTCSRCDYTTHEERSKLGHDEVSHDAKAPTCTEFGWDAYVTCSRCDYTTYVEKSKLGHDEVSHDAKAPACTEIGWDAYVTCSRCDYSTYSEKASLGHDEVSHATQAPTCTKQGYTTHTCSNCGDVYTDTYVDALGHDFQTYVSDNNATCTADGTKTAQCERCDATDTVTDLDSATGHTYGDWIVTINPGCTKNGVEQHNCQDCSHFEIRYVDALGHNYSDTVTEPTCTEQGFTTHTCSNCGDSYTDTYMDALGHDFQTYVSNNDATCTEDGTKTAQCERCDATDTVTDTDSTTGHAYGDWIVTVEPDCVNRGVEQHNCQNCSHFETRDIDPIGHNYSDAVTEPTCTEQGYTIHTCSNCGDVYTDTYVDALGHDFQTYVSDGNASYSADGTKTAQCERCNVTDTIADAGSKLQLGVSTLTVTSDPSTGYPVLNWTMVDDALLYTVFVSTAKDGSYALLYPASANELTLTHTEAQIGQTYFYKICAVNADTAGEFSAIQIGYGCLPQPVIKVTNRASDGKPYISWSAIEGATSYEVYRCGTKNGTYVKMYTAAVDDLDVVHIGAAVGNDYFYTVRAIYGDNPSCNSAFSTAKGVWCDLSQPIVTVSNRASDGKPYIRWTAVTGATGYAVYRCSTKDGTYVRMYTAVDNDLDVVHIGAKAGESYFYKVRALYDRNSKCNSALSTAKGVYCDLSQPSLTVSTRISDGKPYLSWTAVSGADKYMVAYRTTEDSTFRVLYTTADATKLNVTHIGAKNGVTYFYKVRAIDSDNSKCNSSYSMVCIYTMK